MQGQFWNEMLLNFCISLLLPPNVKFRFIMMHKDNEQYNQCHVYKGPSTRCDKSYAIVILTYENDC